MGRGYRLTIFYRQFGLQELRDTNELSPENFFKKVTQIDSRFQKYHVHKLLPILGNGCLVPDRLR